MVLNLSRTLTEALISTEVENYSEFKIKVIEHFQMAIWKIVDLLNNHYSQRLSFPFNLYNWLNHHQQDEVAYFLNEASSNAVNYSEFKIPAAFQLWMGRQGFIIGIAQIGTPFNVNKIKPGGGFIFFRNCLNTIFFDDLDQARIVYLEYLFLDGSNTPELAPDLF